MIFFIAIHFVLVLCLLIPGDLFDAFGPPDPQEPTFDDFLKSIDSKHRHKIRFYNPDFNPKKGFHPDTNNQDYYPFRKHEEDKPEEVPKPDFFKKKMKVLLFFGVCCILISGIPIIILTPA